MRSHSALTCAMLRRWPSWTVTRKFGARKKSVSWVSKRVLGGVEVDAVQHDVEVVAVALDLGMGLALQRGLDGQLVEAEDVAQHRAVGLGRLATSAHTTAPLSG